MGYNEVTSKQVPEWQKIMWRYLDWVCIVIVRAAPAAPATPATRSTCALFASDAARQRGANVAARPPLSSPSPPPLAQMAAAIISVAVPNNGSRGWTSFALLLIELNLVVWVGWWTDRNAGNAIKELQVSARDVRGDHVLRCSALRCLPCPRR